MAVVFFAGVLQRSPSTPEVRQPWFCVTRKTARARPANEWVSSQDRAFTLPQRPSRTAFTIRTWSRRTIRRMACQLIACQSVGASGDAPASVAAADICFPLSRLVKFSRDGRPEGSQPACAWGNVVRWLNPYPSCYRTAFACSLIPCPPLHRSALRLSYPEGTKTGLPRSADGA
jgi:hypothetical protein